MTGLSSDVLERQFGPTRIEVIYQTRSERVICTKSETGQILELSYVQFKQVPAEFALLHQQVLAGESMGKAFRRAGIDFVREVAAACRVTLPPAFVKRFGASGEAPVLSVNILIGPKKVWYAEILETYTPPVTAWQSDNHKLTSDQSAKLKTLEKFIT